MQRHPHPDRRAGRPRLSTDRPLDGHRRRQRGGRVGEHRTKRLAHRLEHLTARDLDLLADNAVMAGRRLRHGLAVGLPQPDAALDIGEQQRHRPVHCAPHPGPVLWSASGPRAVIISGVSPEHAPNQYEPRHVSNADTAPNRPAEISALLAGRAAA